MDVSEWKNRIVYEKKNICFEELIKVNKQKHVDIEEMLIQDKVILNE